MVETAGRLMDLGSPYTDVRVETPSGWQWITALPGLLTINLHPPASGPEIELVFGTGVGVDAADEDYIKSEVERVLQRPVLAIRQRGLSDG